MGPRPAVQEPRPRQRRRILEAFEARARHNGPRSVVMAELARELGISTRTLYQHFTSKAELVQEILEGWAGEVAALREERGRRTDASVQEQLRYSVHVWIDAQERFSQTFWVQVRSDYPEAAATIDRELARSLRTIGRFLLPRLQPDLHPGLALTLLQASVRRALSPRLCDALGLSRREAVSEAIAAWCRGALTEDGAAGRSARPQAGDPSTWGLEHPDILPLDGDD